MSYRPEAPDHPHQPLAISRTRPTTHPMNPRLLHILILLAALAGPARAVQQVIQLLEAQTDATHVGYTLVNPLNAATVFDITLFAVSYPSAQPGPPDPIAPAGWSAQVLALADWSQPIGGVPTGGVNFRPSWAQFTGRAFTSAFAADAAVLGYYVDIALSAGQWSYVPIDPVHPGASLAGFSRGGTVASDFLAAGPVDAGTFVESIFDAPGTGMGTFSGAATTVPEPSAALLVLLGAGLCGCCRRRRQRERSV